MLSDKGGGIAQTTRRFAQKQPSSKECVIAHWSSDPAPKMNGAKRCTEAADLIVLRNIQMVGERSMWGEALA